MPTRAGQSARLRHIRARTPNRQAAPRTPIVTAPAVLVMPNDADVRTAREPLRACEISPHGGAHSTYSTSMPRQGGNPVYTPFATHCIRQRTEKGLSHAYDLKSGWCRFGCGNREDGRIVTREGNVIDQGPSYTDTELADMLQNLTNGASR